MSWFKRAHAADAHNWTYQRQAWSFATTKAGEPSDVVQEAAEVYGTSWTDAVATLGPENYYRPF